MGETAIHDKETGTVLMTAPFVTDAYNFVTIPMFRTYNKNHPLMERALHYVSRSYHNFKMPFTKGVFVAPVSVPETSEGNFSVETPKKVESVPTTRVAKKKTTRKRAKKKTTRKKAPIKKVTLTEIEAKSSPNQ
jgi:hypothetical protein